VIIIIGYLYIIMAAFHGGTNEKFENGSICSGAECIETTSAYKAYSDQMQQRIIEERNALKISIENSYSYLLRKYSGQIRRYNSEHSSLFPNEKLIVQALSQLSALIKYNNFNLRNNFRLQELIIKNIYIYEKQKNS
jgi:hypothetical protein